MELIFKLVSICMIVAIFSLVIKKNQPELAILLGTSASIYCVFCIIELYHQIHQQIDNWGVFATVSKRYFVPLFKCLGISVVSQLGVGVCKDSGQSAVAAALEFSANVATIWCLLPLITHLFRLIEELL